MEKGGSYGPSRAGPGAIAWVQRHVAGRCVPIRWAARLDQCFGVSVDMGEPWHWESIESTFDESFCVLF